MMEKIKWLIVCFLLVSVLGFGEQITKINNLNETLSQLQAAKESGAQETVDLQQEVEELENLSYVEILAREKLNMVYPGETLYVKVVSRE